MYIDVGWFWAGFCLVSKLAQQNYMLSKNGSPSEVQCNVQLCFDWYPAGFCLAGKSVDEQLPKTGPWTSSFASRAIQLFLVT